MQLESLQLESLHRRTPCRLNPFWLLVACLALAPLAVHAQDSAADAAALELYDLLGIEKTVGVAIDQYAEANGVDRQARKKIYGIYRMEVAAMMAKIYSLDELIALKDFYASDLGQSVISKQGQIGEQYAQILIKVLASYKEVAKAAP